ncbi:MAG: NAD-dependent epimerase/dehydratase family protein [Bacteroidales bacterium]
MKKGKYCIAIMSVGSGVGQSVITSCNLSKLPIHTIGFGMNPFAFGAFDCDEMDYVPLIYDKNYIVELIAKCKEHNVDLIIPGSDDEALILTENLQQLEKEGLKVIVSGVDLLRLVRDKEKMCEDLTPIADIFVKSYSYHEIEELIDNGEVTFPIIAKPRGGFASKGVEILLEKKDLIRINESHIIQELAVPKQGDPLRDTYLSLIAKRINPQIAEISAQVVTDRNGDVIGKMASYNKLNNGVPIEIVPYEDDYVWSEINKLLPVLKKLGHKGPLNIQGRLTDKGLKLYEMNARFTGITGWRAIMGFNEVEACIKEWLNIENDIKSLILNYDKFGIRQTTDKAISLSANERVKRLSETLNSRVLKPCKTILVTGASGFLGQTLIKRLSTEFNEVIAFSTSKEKILKLFVDYKNVECHDINDYLNGNLRLGNIDYIVHCGFARPHCTNEEIAESLKFTSELFASATLNQVTAIINISSQSVYGTNQTPKWTEQTHVMPETSYSSAKYATELMLNNACFLNKQTYGTSLRLAALSGGQNGLVMVDVLSKFVERAINGETIEIIGGTQSMERLDVRDAAGAIVNLLNTDCRTWQSVYNLGTSTSFTIIQMANEVKKVAKELYNLETDINVLPSDISLSIGMDTALFNKLVSWSPSYTLYDIIVSLFKYLKYENIKD